MIVLDVNVLLAAHRRDHPHHVAAGSWLASRLADPREAVIVPDLVWVGFIRIAMNPRAFNEPSTLEQASAFVLDVCQAPGYKAVAGVGDGIGLFLDVCREAVVSSRLVTDAYIAAVARAYACPVATFDRDFRRFDGLATLTPSAADNTGT